MHSIKIIVRYCLALIRSLWPFAGKKRLIILMYHRVGQYRKKPLLIPSASFAKQLQFLKNGPFKVDNRPSRNESQVILTFDDGYADFYTEVFPLLKKYKLPAILFICPNIIDKNLDFPWDKQYFKNMNNNKLTWSQVREIASSNLVEIGAHTLNHPDLDKISLAEAEKEITLSKKAIEDNLNRPCRYFAYPRGRFTPKIVDLVKKAGFANAFSTIYGYNDKNADPYLLKRYMLEGTDSLFVFKQILKGALNILAIQGTNPGKFLRKLLSKSY